ncbi:MotA/TolQ/ExbB proton channel family protein [Aeoliella sp. SH292]|uniref:MotA/TolQ/ExbB proton channel family protein n=1 Tax=Aeoliella sp. SH292 TaxID=3454464 RepID=UPI003F9D9A0C
MRNSPHHTPLSYLRSDPECRIGLPGARFTRVGSWLSAAIAAALTTAFYGLLHLTPPSFDYVSDMFRERGPTPYFITFASAWCLTLLATKWMKLSLQQKALRYNVVPEASDFVLSTGTVEAVMERIHETVDDPKHFMLFNRIAIALSNLRNLGRVGDVDEILRSQAEHDESIMESSYSLLRGLIWAIPVLGFIGTVLGLSSAIGGFGDVLATTTDMTQITASLQGVTGGLATAFDTTLLALVAALTLQLLVTFMHKNEEEFCDNCTEYCQRNIVNRLRLMPFHADETPLP